MENSRSDDGDPRLTHDLPYPIAWRYEYARAPGSRAGLRYPRTLAFAENIVRFLALVNLAEAGHSGKSGFEGWKREIGPYSSFGKWTGIFSAAMAAGNSFLPEAKRLSTKGLGLDDITTVYRKRNDFAHGGLGSGEVLCQDGVDLIKEPMAKIQAELTFLAGYRLGWVEPDEGGWVWVESQGQVECRRSPVQRNPPPFAPERVVLWRERKALCLEPWFVVESGHLFWVTKIKGAQAEYTPAGRAQEGVVPPGAGTRRPTCDNCPGRAARCVIGTNCGAPELPRPVVTGYDLLGCLAAEKPPGGLGAVWQASANADPRKRVAIRILGIVDEDKFNVVRALKHSHMLSPIELVKAKVGADPRAAVVTPFEPGDTLTQWLKDSGKLTPGEASAHLTQVLDALDHALRETGLTHGALTADEILITGQGVKLMNFGTAAWLGRETKPDLPAVAAILAETVTHNAPRFLLQRLGEIRRRAALPADDSETYRTPRDFAEALHAAIALQGVPLEGALDQDAGQKLDKPDPRGASVVAQRLLRHVEARWPQPIALAVQRVAVERATGGPVATCARACEAAEVAIFYTLWRETALKQRASKTIPCAPDIAFVKEKVRSLLGEDVAVHLENLRAFQEKPDPNDDQPLVALALLLRALEPRVGSDLVLCGEPDTSGFAPLIFALGTTAGSWPSDRIKAKKRGAWLHAGPLPTPLSPLIVLDDEEPDILIVRGVVGDTVRYWSSLKGRIVSRRDLKQARAVRKKLG